MFLSKIYNDYETNQFYNRIGEKDKPLNWKTIKSTYQKKKNKSFSKFEYKYKYVYLKDDSNMLTIRLNRWLAERDNILKENNTNEVDNKPE
jgi:hypothetical protein